jgi:hypothetical protein
MRDTCCGVCDAAPGLLECGGAPIAAGSPSADCVASCSRGFTSMLLPVGGGRRGLCQGIETACAGQGLCASPSLALPRVLHWLFGWCCRWCCWRRVRAAGMCHPRGHHKSGAYEGGSGKSAAACNSTSDVSRCGCQGFLLQVMCIWTLIPTPWTLTPDVDTHAWVWCFFAVGCCMASMDVHLAWDVRGWLAFVMMQRLAH